MIAYSMKKTSLKFEKERERKKNNHHRCSFGRSRKMCNRNDGCRERMKKEISVKMKVKQTGDGGQSVGRYRANIRRRRRVK